VITAANSSFGAVLEREATCRATLSDAHIWIGDARTLPSNCLKQILSEEERTRAALFTTAELRRRYIAAHGMKRVLLANYVQSDSRTISFRAGKHGKPCLHGHEGVYFSLSHSGDVIALAVASFELGLDVERLRPLDDLEELAHAVCSQRELSRLRAIESPDRATEFLRLWTCKEAYVKATGEGLARQSQH
jgi:4'-phosphopantetheinyl transferase